MPYLLPFRGWRYDLSQVGSLADVLAPPPQSISDELRDRLYRRHPCNVVRAVLNREEPGDLTPDDRRRRSGEFLRLWQHEGILLQEGDDALYVLETVFPFEGLRLQRWAVAGRFDPGHGSLPVSGSDGAAQASTEPHDPPQAGADASSLLAGLSPRLLLCEGPSTVLAELLEPSVRGRTPIIAALPEGVTHRLWPVSGAAVTPITRVVSAALHAVAGVGGPRMVWVLPAADETLLTTARPDRPPDFLVAEQASPGNELDPGQLWPPVPLGLVMDLQEFPQ